MKNGKWLIVRITNSGIKTGGHDRYTSYEAACMMQEILEEQNPYTGFLVYTVEEWEQEKALYGWY